MKRVVFIGNRTNVLKELPNFESLVVIQLFIQKDSLLEREIGAYSFTEYIPIRYFSVADKAAVLKEIKDLDFDILISNGCPLILPVTAMKKSHQLFINIHPTLLPDLKGKTPLSGVFMTHRTAIGSTMHYIDDGIDTGYIIAQERIELTADIDQGLVYKLSFDSESIAFRSGMQAIIAADYNYPGSKQTGEGSYFNRTNALQTISIIEDDTDTIIDKIKSFGIKGQGAHLQLNNKSYLIYAAEKIINPYLLATYGDTKTGQIALVYDDKFVLKTRDGLVKIIDYDTEDHVA